MGEKDKNRGRLEVNIQKNTILVIWVVFVLFLLTIFSNSSTVNMKYNDAKNQFLILLRVYKNMDS